MLFNTAPIRYDMSQNMLSGRTMRILTTTLLVAIMTLAACGAVRDSRVNPLNWFGGSRSEPIQRDAQQEVNPLIPQTDRVGLFANTRDAANAYLGTPIDQISELVIERVPGGAILRVTGVSEVLGIYDVRLTPTNVDDVADADGVLTYRLEGVRPARVVRGGTEPQRTVTAGRHLTDNQLARAQVIRIEGRLNAQTTARR
jgi:hypothetical protein